MKYAIAVAMLFVVLSAGALANAQSSNIFFKGHGISSTAGADLTIYASYTTDGIVRGEVVPNGGFQGEVVELALQPGNIWCIKQLLEGMPGTTWIWLIADLPGGDQLGWDGVSGHSCANASLSQPPEPIDIGGFTGEIVPDTTAADLAQCEADLAVCEGGCTLPPLTAPYEAKLSGGLYLDPSPVGLELGKIKIAAKKYLNGSVSGYVKFPDGTAIAVSDIVPPHGCVTHWCIKDTDGLWFVRDTGTGCDLVSYSPGANLSCATDTPSVLFDAGLPGDFKGRVRDDTGKACLRIN